MTLKKEFKSFEQQIKLIKNDGWNFLHPNDLLHLEKKNKRKKCHFNFR